MNNENKDELKKMKENGGKKKIIKRIIIILLVLFVGVIVVNILPFLYFVFCVLYDMFIDIPAKPKVKHGEFPFELVYEYKGNKITIRDTIICDYDGYSYALESGNTNDWDCEFENNEEYGLYYIDKENVPDLYIVVPVAADYYMGDKKTVKEESEPYIRYVDEDSVTYYEEKYEVDVVDIKIIEWKSSGPLKNNFK